MSGGCLPLDYPALSRLFADAHGRPGSNQELDKQLSRLSSTPCFKPTTPGRHPSTIALSRSCRAESDRGVLECPTLVASAGISCGASVGLFSDPKVGLRQTPPTYK